MGLVINFIKLYYRYSRDIRIEFVLWLFAWSKLFELGDTVFMVFRKRKVIFLHWFHHTLTLITMWQIFGQGEIRSDLNSIAKFEYDLQRHLRTFGQLV